MPALASKVETLRWRDGRFEMIDQRALPAVIRYLQFESAAAVAGGIRSMVVRGAPAIGCAAAYGVALEALRLQNKKPADFGTGLEAGFAALAASRPTAVNLFWALARMRNAWQTFGGSTPAQIAPMLLAEAHAIYAADIEANHRMGEHGAKLIKDGARVLTHCNAGALATAGYGTALGVIRSAVAAGKQVNVFANETRPFLQGARLTAWELIVVGADRIAANGDVANKIGTYSVAVLAQRHRVPFYVAAPLSTIDANVARGADIPIEERSADEIRGYGETRWAPDHATARNPVFDVTPAELVTGLITEKGVVPAPDAGKIRKLLGK
jgi:methylthioribose-1-phosphate isomerase